MLVITIPASELWNEKTQTFDYTKEQTIQLEHSLVSISKWESKWHKPFLSKKDKTFEETMDYIRCMTLTQNVDPNVYSALTQENIDKIDKYIRDPMTATTFSDDKSGKNNREIVTAEVIYHWMIAQNIPAEYRKWHLNKLIALIRVCSIKNTPPGKRKNSKDLASQYAALNMARRKQLNSKG